MSRPADEAKLRELMTEAYACEKEVDGYKALFEAALMRADNGAVRIVEGQIQASMTRWMEAKASTYALARRMR